MTDEQIAALEALAQAATPYWSEDYSRLEDILICGRDDSKEYAATVCHVRAANPATILALIRRLREAEADAKRFRWLADDIAGGNCATQKVGDDWWFHGIAWNVTTRREDIRAAIDDARGEKA